MQVHLCSDMVSVVSVSGWWQIIIDVLSDRGFFANVNEVGGAVKIQYLRFLILILIKVGGLLQDHLHEPIEC